MASIEVAEGLGTGPFNSNVFPVGSMSEGVTHNISVSLLRGPTDITSYSLFLDDSLLLSSTFVLNDPRGINAVELEQSGRSEPSPIGSALIDDLNVVPEPATYALFALGVAILLNFRRRQRLCH